MLYTNRLFLFCLQQSNADISYSALSKIPGLKPVMPAGAMYMMVSSEVHTLAPMKVFSHRTAIDVTYLATICA